MIKRNIEQSYKVVAEQISGLLSRSLGISTARSSGSFMESVFRWRVTYAKIYGLPIMSRLWAANNV